MGSRNGRSDILFAASAAAAALLIAACILAPALLPFDPNQTDVSLASRAPGTDGFLLGSDGLGRDVLMRTLAGGHESILYAIAVVVLATGIGSLAGIVAGFFGGVADALLSKVVVAFQAFPSFVLAIALAAMLGPGGANMVIAIVAVYWTQFARLARSLASSMRDAEFIRAACVCGAGRASLLLKYVLPNLASPLIVMAALSLGDVILTMAGLSFLGLGPAQPSNEWGAMMSDARSGFQTAPWGIAVPGVALFIAVSIFNLLGDSLRDRLDARGSRRRGMSG